MSSFHRHARGWLATVIAILAIGSSVTSLPNVFVQDDIPVILKNKENQSLDEPWQAFSRPYWPKPFSPDLYRPLMSVGLTAQWVAGGGSPLAFRVTSILLYAACAVAVFWLALLLLPVNAAFLASAFFAVHPLHVEAVAVAVNQGELIVGILACLWTGLYIRARSRGDISARAALGFILTYVIACFFKENAVILPGLLIAAELSVITDQRPLRQRVAAVRPLILALTAAGLVFLTIRSLVLESPVGTFTAEGLKGLSMGQRALTMLGVVPEWVRLLVWPAHLQADYSPQEIGAAAGWGPAQVLGLVLVLSAAIGAWVARRAMPVVTFGLLWIGIALFPVSNVLVPTGIVLAERALFLSSIGFALAMGAGLRIALDATDRQRRSTRLMFAAATGFLLVIGLIASARRQRTWANPFTHAANLLLDAPLSYRSHFGAASLLWEGHQRDASLVEYQRAIALYPATFFVPRDLADHLRLDGRCAEAIPYYRLAVRQAPDQNEVRSSMIACLLYEGHYAEARSQARIGLAVDGGGGDSLNLRKFLATAEQAVQEQPAAGTVRITPLPSAGDSAGASP